MKKILLVLISLMLNNFANAQFKIIYEQTRDVENQLQKLDKVPDAKLREQLRAKLTKPTYFELLLNGNESFYKEIELIDDDNALPQTEGGIQVNITKSGSTGTYLNYKTKEYISSWVYRKRDFVIQDKIVKFDWKLTNETKKIGNFNAKKATATHNGKEIEAWYAEEVPINGGPNEFNGLPGLIVQLNTENTTFNAISVEKLSKKPTIEKPVQKGKVVTREEFRKIRESRL